jgi:hypothetical protein
MRTIANAKAEQRLALVRALSGLPPDVPAPEPETPGRTTSLDGGARKTPERVPSHEETLTAILAERRADVGRFLGD